MLPELFPVAQDVALKLTEEAVNSVLIFSRAHGVKKLSILDGHPHNMADPALFISAQSRAYK